MSWLRCALPHERVVQIRPPHITLSALLKFASVVMTGAEAKTLIRQRHVRVNGETEIRRGRKVVVGDRVDVEGTGLTLVIRHSNAPVAPSLDP